MNPRSRSAIRLQSQCEQGVLDTIEGSGAEYRRVLQLAEPHPHREQAGGKVTAVNRRDVLRVERKQRAGVVPVVEMPSEALQLAHRPERVLGAAQQLPGGDVAEVMSDEICQQRHAHVRGGGARCDHGSRILLIVVRW
jgi:hypothetical protein